MKQIDIHSLFFPSQHITDPKWFAGRKDDIESALQTLCTPGASMIVYGDRGSGKTSFMEMVKLLAKGQSHLIYKHKLHKRFSPDKFKFKVISFTCNEETNSTAKVLQNLITNPDGIKKLIPARKEQIEETVKDKFSFDLLKLFSAGIENENKITFSEYKEESIFELFTNLITTVSKELIKPDEGLLIVVDEFDLVGDSSKMASLIKTLSKDNVKFLLGGIASNYADLLKGHRSIGRQLVYGRIRIDLMAEKEIKEVYDLVTENTNQKIRFGSEFITLVKNKSNGYPYYVQLFGKLSADEYIKSKGFHTPMLIHNQHLMSGLKKLSFYEEQMEEDYQNIIKENPHKELAIKFLARQVSRKIKDEELFSHCYNKNIRQPIPKNTLTSLLSSREPHFLIREKEDSDYVVFKDSLFKVFINSREPVLLRFRENEYEIPL
jgi:KAP-like P-loop domain-containing protein